MKRNMAKWMFVISTLVMSITGVLVHLLITIIAYYEHGITTSVLTLLLPFASEIYWLYKLWNIQGYIFDNFKIGLFVFTISCTISYMTSNLFKRSDDTVYL